MSDYYHSDHLAKFGTIAEGNKELAGKFFDWYGAVFKEGALSEREKALIALAVAHAVQCPYCIDAFSKTCLEKGADLDQMTEGSTWRRPSGVGPAWCTASRCWSTSKRRGCK